MTDRNIGHLKLMDRKFKFCFDYLRASYLPIVDKPEKTKHKWEITDCFSHPKTFFLRIPIDPI